MGNQIFTRNFSVHQSANKGENIFSPMADTSKKSLFSPRRENGLHDLHAKMNAHRLMFENGYEIDLSQSRMITDSRPLAGRSNSKN